MDAFICFPRFHRGKPDLIKVFPDGGAVETC
jgi:hypothetical protein